MSVINQMLKDLEQRSPTNGQTQVQPTPPKKAATVKIILITIIVLLGLNGLGLYIWQLQERVAESEAKSQQITHQLISKSANESVKASVKQSTDSEHSFKTNEQDNQPMQAAQSTKPESVQTAVALSSELQPKTEQHSKSQSINEPLQAQSAEIISSRANDNVSPKPATLAPKLSVTQNKINKQTAQLPTNMPTEPIASKGKMTVSRRQLTSSELVEQTLAKAEKSIANNEIAKAEQLFEEILIIDPNQKQARKKLAALWFGRQSYQQAVNLLSQGIAIDKLDSEMRIMKAQIQVKQGQPEAAYNTLKPLNSLEQEEYQVMLANLAQQVEQFPAAIMAYEVLIKMQPYSGRWYLGLAIVYDKNSQFSLAVNAYTLALSKADLSASSAKFAKQRLQALGE